MSEPTTKSNVTPNDGKKSNMPTVLGVLLLLSLLFGGYLFVQNMSLKDEIASCSKNVDQTEIARKSVIDELNAMEAQYTELSEVNEVMSDELIAEREKIKQLVKQAKNNNWSIAKLKKEANTLREIMKGYLVTIDSLNTMNIELTEENTSVKGELADQKTKYTSLEEVKQDLADKVKIGSLIQLVNVSVSGQIKKNSGAQKLTEKAGRADVVKACYTIPQNSIAQTGTKVIYMRIISPFGSVLGGQKDPGFVVNGREGIFTHMKKIEYAGSAMNDCMYWEVSDPLTAGKYNVQLYSEGRELSAYTLTLK